MAKKNQKENGQTPNGMGELEQLLLSMRDSFRQHQNDIRRRYKISANEMEIILFIKQAGPQRMKSIGEKFQIKFSTLTSLVDKIERLNLVKRINSKDDRRSILVTLTKKGERMLGEYDGQAIEIAGAIKEGNSQGVVSSVIDVLEKVVPEVKE
jgi:DNA-binding MarR family transcriptional regulator